VFAGVEGDGMDRRRERGARQTCCRAVTR